MGEIVRSGYKLHPQHTSRWQPSWLKSDGNSSEEDQRQSEDVVDAIRIRDGLPVVLKMVHPVESPHELAMNHLFRSLSWMPDNHCLPMLDVIKLQCSESQDLMVFPHLPRFHRSRIRTFKDFVVFMTQICEGIQFMHRRHIAYGGNCTPACIVFDPSGTNDWSNLSRIDRSQTFIRKAKQRFKRMQLEPRYYLTDFGLSRQYTPRNAPDSSSRTHDILTPETRLDEFNDPFSVDIYCLGSLVRENFVQKYQGFDFLRDLVDAMTDADPERRPTIDQVVERLELASASLSEIDRRSTFVLKDPGLTWTARLFHTLSYNLQRRSSMAVP